MPKRDFITLISKLVCLAESEPPKESRFIDENIKIEIGENEQIGNIILVIKNRLNPYDVEIHKELVKKELEKRGYCMETIEEWLNYIE